jgi:YopX protein.|nr:MAG TPA: YopX protein [Caudoviricetes sp.]
MRPLKYKAYIKDYHKIADVEILELLPNGEVQSVVIADDELNEEVYRVTKGQFDLLEFTGFLDNNKKDIYTNHIIKCDVQRNVKALQGFIAKVIWDKVYATYGIEHPDEGFFPLWNIGGYEIIGNIYQDKELLND